MKKLYSIVPVPIIVAMIAAVSTNLDRITTYLRVLHLSQPSSANGVAGKWVGVFREYVHTTKKQEISTETVIIRQNGNLVDGDVSTSDKMLREWNMTGQFEQDFLTLRVFGIHKAGPAVAAYVLKGDPDMGMLKGFWTGFDPEARKLMTCPYLLTRGKDIEQIKIDNAAWLNQACYEADPDSTAAKS